MIKVCQECGERFDTPYKWARVCKPCFVEQKKNEFVSMEEDRDYWKQRAIKAEERGYGSVELSPEMLRRLLQLCHPDRHGGSDAAMKATRWLLEQRR